MVRDGVYCVICQCSPSFKSRHRTSFVSTCRYYRIMNFVIDIDVHAHKQLILLEQEKGPIVGRTRRDVHKHGQGPIVFILVVIECFVKSLRRHES